MSIADNLKKIEEKITKAAEISGRKREDVLLLAVSKTVDVPRIKEAVNLGLVDLGEVWGNRKCKMASDRPFTDK